MLRKLILCLDGTWNHPDDDQAQDRQVETNVRGSSRPPSTVRGVPDQIKWYDDGIGNHCWFDRLGAGAFGLGLDEKILDAYRYLAETYEDGDRVFLFGYSRGVYSARSLIGLIRKCGFSTATTLSKKPAKRTPFTEIATPWIARRPSPFASADSREITIDPDRRLHSVGALGIPLEMFAFYNRKKYEFHDVMLSSIVELAYHAMALDEHRKVFDITLWDPPAPVDQVLEQRWFPGSHADVGGGEPDRRLSDIALGWMM